MGIAHLLGDDLPHGRGGEARGAPDCSRATGRARAGWSGCTLAARGALLGAMLLVDERAEAHLMAVRQATINLRGDAAYSAISLPASALSGADDDHDGLLSGAELVAHESTLQAELGRRWRLTSGGAQARVVRVDLVPQPPDDAPSRPADQVVVLHHAQFASPPQVIELDTDLFGQGASDEQLTLTATRPGVRHRVMLRPPRARASLFDEGAAGVELIEPSEPARPSSPDSSASAAPVPTTTTRAERQPTDAGSQAQGWAGVLAGLALLCGVVAQWGARGGRVRSSAGGASAPCEAPSSPSDAPQG